MKTYVRIGLAVVLAGAALATAAATGNLHHDGHTTALPNGPYVALGDSYTSGPNVPDQTGRPAGCARSDHNYPALVAKELDLTAADFHDMSCSGATIADLSTPQSTGNGVNPAQLSALSATTRLVTVGIGGNDIGFSTLIGKCVAAGVFYYATGNGRYIPGDSPCKDQYVSGGSDQVQRKIQAAREPLTAALGEVKRRAPHARVYVVGYPAILPSGGTGCANDMRLAPGDVAFLHQEEQLLNTMLRQRAAAAGATYVDMYAPSVGRDACSASGTRWIEPLVPAVAAVAVHPNERGERGMADAVLHAIDGSR
jgi:hypothetical protein